MDILEKAKAIGPADRSLLLIIIALIDMVPDQKALLLRLTEIAADPDLCEFSRELLAVVRAEVRCKLAASAPDAPTTGTPASPEPSALGDDPPLFAELTASEFEALRQGFGSSAQALFDVPLPDALVWLAQAIRSLSSRPVDHNLPSREV